MILEFEEIKLLSTEVTDTTKYPSIGLFVVNDGVISSLVYNSGSYIATLPIPNNKIPEEYKGEEDYSANLKRFEAILKDNTQLQEIKAQLDQLTTLLQKPQTSNFDMNLKDLTKLVAVVQDAQLIKD